MKKVHTRSKRKRCMHTHLCGAKKFKESKLKMARLSAAKQKVKE